MYDENKNTELSIRCETAEAYGDLRTWEGEGGGDPIAEKIHYARKR